MRVIVEHGWNPPTPTEGGADRILDDMRMMGEHDAPHLHPSATLDLTDHQLVVLSLLAAGLKYAEVADELDLEHETIKEQTATIRRKLGARNTAHAVALAFRLDVLR